MIEIPKENIKNISINGLNGRMVHIINETKEKTIIFLHGQHSMQERVYTICEYFSDYGEVYAPDLPGFGGMDSFYNIGMEPTIDNYADYIYSFLKSIKPKNELIIVSVSNGSQYMTRFLQKFPDVKVNKAISFAGFGSSDDFNIKKSFRVLITFVSNFCKTNFGAKIFNAVVLNRLSIKLFIWVLTKNQTRLKDESGEKIKDLKKLESNLWRVNDTRTHAFTTLSMLKTDLKNYSDKPLDVSLYNVATKKDQFFDNNKVSKSLGKIYRHYEEIPLNIEMHAPSIIATKSDVEAMTPKRLKELLSA